MDIEIRKATKKDRDAFVELSLELTKFNRRQHDQHYDDFDEVLKIRKIRSEKKFNEIDQKDNMQILLAYADKKAVGYAKSYIVDQKMRVGYCNELYVKEEVRGKGVGKKLFDMAMQWMKEKKVVRVMVSVYLWNDAAKSFYEKRGFKPYAASYEKKLSR